MSQQHKGGGERHAGEERLRAIGIHLADDTRDPGVRAECSRIARTIVARSMAAAAAGAGGAGAARVVGLMPVTPGTAIPPLAVQLGLAVVELTGLTCAVVDANVHWPALSRLIEDDPRREDDEAFFATRWLHGSLALLTPPQAGPAGAGLPELARLVEHGRELFAFMFADLTGFDVLGEHLGAMALVEGIVLVAPAGKITEAQLLEWYREVPPDKRLGVLLQGSGAR